MRIDVSSVGDGIDLDLYENEYYVGTIKNVYSIDAIETPPVPTKCKLLACLNGDGRVLAYLWVDDKTWREYR